MICKFFYESSHKLFTILKHGHRFSNNKIIRDYSALRQHFYSNKTAFNMGSSSGKFQINKSRETKQVHMSSPTSSSVPSQSNQTSTVEDYVEDVVCKASDLEENEPKVFDLQDGKVLLIKQNGRINALGTKCTHYGAPLEKSAVGEGRLRCQWHGACFNILTGDIEDFPGLDSLPCYQVTIEDDNVKVRAKKSELKSNKRSKPMAKLSPEESQKIVVVGGGPTGAVCIETLRQEGFKGKITLVAKEEYLPYDRIKLSKALDIDINTIQLRNSAFYKENDIEILTNVLATGVDSKKKLVSLSNGKTLNYDKLFIATGSTPKRPNVPGASLQNIFVLREYEDVKIIKNQVTPENEAVIVGSSFIGMECAAYLAGKVKKVSVIGRSSVPFSSSFGERIGTALMRLFTEKGVQFYMNCNVKEFKGNNENQIVGVKLTNGTTLPANFIICGLGSTLNTQFLARSGVQINGNGTVEVNEFLKTNLDNIFAGGDIANAPIFTHNNTKASIGHWGLSHYHGRMAALNMLGRNESLKTIPFFWTMVFGKSVRYAGHGPYDDIFYTGDVEELKFVAFYLKENQVVAISSCQMDPVVSQFAEYMMQGKRISKSDLEMDPFGWTNQGK